MAIYKTDLEKKFNPQELADAVHIQAIRECVTWLALNCENYKPEYLAGNMALDLLEQANE